MIHTIALIVFVLMALQGLVAFLFLGLIFAGAHYDWPEDGLAFRITVAVGRIAIFPRQPKSER